MARVSRIRLARLREFQEGSKRGRKPPKAVSAIARDSQSTSVTDEGALVTSGHAKGVTDLKEGAAFAPSFAVAGYCYGGGLHQVEATALQTA